ncbi:hypothetical protein CT0861_09503 [Colletotrichum tofieldiae]|uniref:Uncharacterized protein n=1 Tax=Colletotrichum tofieldiae TaxID=708197 RepID=A0A161W043_9PEZI|nr:hypothetical protein CT0861_09503 [Colletotrichum tofieldiae]
MALNTMWEANETRCNEITTIISVFEQLPKGYEVLDEDEHWLLAIALQKLVLDRLYKIRPKLEMVKRRLALAREALRSGQISAFDTDMSTTVAKMKIQVEAWQALKAEQTWAECI